MRGEYIKGDCMEYLSGYKDNYFSLAIVDPPYGLGKKLTNGGSWAKDKKAKNVYWDKVPNEKYFKELFRVSKNYIIWGGNYFSHYIQGSRCCLVWRKPQLLGMKTLSSFELALTSFDRVSKIYNSNIVMKKRLHPTQKPVALYRWLLQNYAKPNDLILDTHVGSASSLIACEMEGFKYVGFEKDADYYEMSTKRIKQHLAQKTLF